MNGDPLLMIGIPAFERVPLLFLKCTDLQSAEMRRNYSITISDDSSGLSLESLKINGVSYIRHEATGNAVDNWNHLLELSESRWTWILHHDEYVNNVEAVINECKKAESIGRNIIIFDTQVLDGGSVRAAGSKLLKRLCVIFPRLLWCINPIGSPSAICVRHSMYRKYRTDLQWLVDVENFIAIFKSENSVLFSDIKLFSKVTGTGSITSSIDDVAYLHFEELEACEKSPFFKFFIKIFLRLRYKKSR